MTDLYDEMDASTTNSTKSGNVNQKELHDLTEEDLPTPKRARLDINYSIGPAGAFQSLPGSQGTQQQNRRKMTLVNRIV